MTASMSARVMATACMEFATATLVTMAMTAAKATPSPCSRVTTLSVKMAPNVTTLLTTVGLSVSAQQAMLVHFVKEKSLMIHALVRPAVVMDFVLLRKVGKLPSVTATAAGGESPVIKRLISVRKRANRVEITASV